MGKSTSPPFRAAREAADPHIELFGEIPKLRAERQDGHRNVIGVASASYIGAATPIRPCNAIPPTSLRLPAGRAS
jgi:hypothetical protein